ncbi:succinylglutamate desuccinylase/aspartoacylase family protein [Pseudomaricurvus sp. HS19]|uniref:succinylglutamate desuccinylase/aspartoacylase family protein n=1 Tax=Pseudomaricurvus sp. HS19 TaxID=2692626 RepID=UPI00136D9964|nr:succinylglutamate desuccinylase/aspartoacylase family protein [Pseudomaricurvus sp. HS19]MYM65087.1 succinylglutamate desuccinylase [Pseudomaricurvus sp. HS19]
MTRQQQPFTIAGQQVKPGERVYLNVPVAKLYTDTDVSIPVHVIHGKKPGPKVFVSAAVHGDELNGIEIISRLIHSRSLSISSGTLILVPMVNVYGVLNQSRYLPDRRDLNRSFPGSAKGSLAGRVANLFLTEIVNHCDYGIDLHTGAIHRSNLPQIRANLDDEETAAMARVFGVPVLLNSNLRDGSLRQAAMDSGIKILLYEAGEALRFDELSIRAGVSGVLNVLSHLGLIRRRRRTKQVQPFVANSSSWVRASSSGIIKTVKELGDQVQEGDVLAHIGDPFGHDIDVIRAERSGFIIGKQNIPLAQEGEALFHIAFFAAPDEAILENIESLQETHLPNDGDYDRPLD